MPPSQTPPGKNIVLCCDGTANQLDGEFSNVARLYSVLVKDPARQVAYYDPGVGTLGDARVVSPGARKVSEWLGLAFGYGFRANLTDAYTFLMDSFEEGDRVFLFGFSRGAFTARALAGVLHTCGLVEKRNHNLLPYLFGLHMRSFDRATGDRRSESRTDGRVDGATAAARFKSIYGREVRPHFLGLWDTVTSLGWVYGRKRYPNSTRNPGVLKVRHAVALDEQRAQYRQNLWGARAGQDVRQVWFAGAHSDVGGGYPERESGLSKIPLEWIIAEACQEDLIVDEAKYRDVVLGDGPGSHARPDHRARLHRSLKGLWWALEGLPGWNHRRGVPLPPPLGARRRVAPDATIHQSVFDRDRDCPDYKPTNLPGYPGRGPSLLVEPYSDYPDFGRTP